MIYTSKRRQETYPIRFDIVACPISPDIWIHFWIKIPDHFGLYQRLDIGIGGVAACRFMFSRTQFYCYCYYYYFRPSVYIYYYYYNYYHHHDHHHHHY